MFELDGEALDIISLVMTLLALFAIMVNGELNLALVLVAIAVAITTVNARLMEFEERLTAIVQKKRKKHKKKKK